MTIFQKEVDEIVKRLRQNPDADISDLQEMMTSRYSDSVEVSKMQLLGKFLLICYDYQTEVCLRDLAKMMLVYPADYKPSHQEVFNMLRCFWYPMKLLCDQDSYNKMVDYIQSHVHKDDYDFKDLPYN